MRVWNRCVECGPLCGCEVGKLCGYKVDCVFFLKIAVIFFILWGGYGTVRFLGVLYFFKFVGECAYVNL